MLTQIVVALLDFLCHFRTADGGENRMGVGVVSNDVALFYHAGGNLRAVL